MLECTAASAASAKLERESRRKLQHAGQSVWADFLQGSEIARTRVRHQITSLLGMNAVAAGGRDGVVLDLLIPLPFCT
jgi:hypothetical protein